MSTTNTHPVDSTPRTCCGSIGEHAPDCYAATDVTGIDYGTQRRVIGRWAGLAVQPLVTRRPGEAEPGIDLNEVRDGSLQGLFAGPLSPAEALELARALVVAADEAQRQAEAVAQ